MRLIINLINVQQKKDVALHLHSFTLHYIHLHTFTFTTQKLNKKINKIIWNTFGAGWGRVDLASTIGYVSTMPGRG